MLERYVPRANTLEDVTSEMLTQQKRLRREYLGLVNGAVTFLDAMERYHRSAGKRDATEKNQGTNPSSATDLTSSTSFKQRYALALSLWVDFADFWVPVDVKPSKLDSFYRQLLPTVAAAGYNLRLTGYQHGERARTGVVCGRSGESSPGAREDAFLVEEFFVKRALKTYHRWTALRDSRGGTDGQEGICRFTRTMTSLLVVHDRALPDWVVEEWCMNPQLGASDLVVFLLSLSDFVGCAPNRILERLLVLSQTKSLPAALVSGTRGERRSPVVLKGEAHQLFSALKQIFMKGGTIGDVIYAIAPFCQLRMALDLSGFDHLV